MNSFLKSWFFTKDWPNGLSAHQSSRRPGSSHTKDSKMVLDAALFNTQQYKVEIKDKVEQSKERSSAFPYTSVL